eukprot:CAMPEP_0175042790 /NCGR_PEP_ID=MMETSP0052_2-20121109/2783_1 /TAXON_ID=51329 ORGANISM="Polytomella parva, Strain SAG 63-3" /NCGR_SAMPLE_ID=MMETSP0052_2 /ASSEMBLY_ACC=CAM_ASM_000194 /LENGTH=344 /DNA_ID=CAMNT_0016305689 /DNA_START=506 /DNA_END=1540 /DNA_ORIENTATION=+
MNSVHALQHDPPHYSSERKETVEETEPLNVNDGASRNENHPPGNRSNRASHGPLLIASDGSAQLYFLDPGSPFSNAKSKGKEAKMQGAKLSHRRFTQSHKINVTDNDQPIPWLNELEWIENEIWANVYQTDCIARIHPQSGKVIGWILLSGLQNRAITVARSMGIDRTDVLNGIAWDPKSRRIFVTGKWWPLLFEIQLVPMGSHSLTRPTNTTSTSRNTKHVSSHPNSTHPADPNPKRRELRKVDDVIRVEDSPNDYFVRKGEPSQMLRVEPSHEKDMADLIASSLSSSLSSSSSRGINSHLMTLDELLGVVPMRPSRVMLKRARKACFPPLSKFYVASTASTG